MDGLFPLLSAKFPEQVLITELFIPVGLPTISENIHPSRDELSVHIKMPLNGKPQRGNSSGIICTPLFQLSWVDMNLKSPAGIQSSRTRHQMVSGALAQQMCPWLHSCS